MIFFHKYTLKWCICQIYPTLYKFTSIIVGQNRKISKSMKNAILWNFEVQKPLFSPIFPTLIYPYLL